MIYTVTLSPSLDYTLSVSQLILGGVNRAEEAQFCVGGKGINVSVMLHNLGVKSVALGYVAGFTGREIVRRLGEKGCCTDFIELGDGNSRINVGIISNIETKLNADGPQISDAALEQLFCKLDAPESGDTLVLSGSVPSGVPVDIYGRIMERLAKRRIRIVVDATGEQLKCTLKYRPFLVKPNHHELGELFGVTLKARSDMEKYAKKLQEMGARNVLISMAEEGAFLVCESGEVVSCTAPKGALVNSVGAGDSMVGGFLAAFLESGNLRRALAMGVAAGSATAFGGCIAEKGKVLDELAKLSCN